MPVIILEHILVKFEPNNLIFESKYNILIPENARITNFMGSTWGPPGSCRPKMGPMLAPRTLLSGWIWKPNWWQIFPDLSVLYKYSHPLILHIANIIHSRLHYIFVSKTWLQHIWFHFSWKSVSGTAVTDVAFFPLNLDGLSRHWSISQLVDTPDRKLVNNSGLHLNPFQK